MKKWNVIIIIMVILMVMTIIVGGEAKPIRQRRTWIECFRYCSRNCNETDGNCYEGCKIKCGGPTPTKTNSRKLHVKKSTIH
ncbi:unnamed protein product [Cochlearia groenlandica]